MWILPVANLNIFLACWLLLLVLTSTISNAAFPPTLRYSPLPVTINKIETINRTCDATNFNITLTLEQPFKGLVFAKDFSQECNAEGTYSKSVTIHLPTSGCGVQLISTADENGLIKMAYSVTLVVQQDKYLRQIVDYEKRIECAVDEKAFLIKSKSMAEALADDLLGTKKNHRAGRLKDEGWSKDLEGEQLQEELDEALAAARAWMEIVPEEVNEKDRTLQVGDYLLLTVKSTLPTGISWRIVDCFAHDGLGDSSQKLLDDVGCPIDEFLMPMPKFGPIRPIALMRHQEATARFAAFKFPDRDRLHLSCGLQLCRGFCPKIECENRNESANDNRLGRRLDGDGEILDRLEVFNSVEVIDEIDDYRKSGRSGSEPSLYPFSNLPGDRTVCVSPDKMAVAFCVLGLIFLCAVIIAACALLRARRSGQSVVPYYTRSLFSSSSSGGESAFGSKLLLRDSPSCTGQSTSRGLQYGRIL